MSKKRANRQMKWSITMSIPTKASLSFLFHDNSNSNNDGYEIHF